MPAYYNLEHLGSLSLAALHTDDRSTFWGYVRANTTDAALIGILNALHYGVPGKWDDLVLAAEETQDQVEALREAVQTLQGVVETVTVTRRLDSDRGTSEEIVYSSTIGVPP